ncbi:MAG: nucleotidyltransferase domain-containing protein [Candidatus Nanohaloarchaea archaeon]
MNEINKPEIKEYTERVKDYLGDRLEKIIIYGSYARNEQLPGSDVDIAIIVTEKRKNDRKHVFELGKDFLLEKNIVFSPRVFEKEEFERKVKQGYGFYKNVYKEGIEV